MKNFRLSLCGLTLLALVSACTPVATESPTPSATETSVLPPTLSPTETAALPPTLSPTATPLPPAATPTSSALTVEMLKNAEYPLGTEGSQMIRLVDGHYTGETFTVDLIEPIAWGDLNGDGLEDAAVLLSENTEGTGIYVTLVGVLNQGGQPVPTRSKLIDDRPVINALSIQNQRIRADVLIHSINDPMCCPTFPVVETFQVQANELVLVRFTSQTPTGLARVIDIASPQSGAEVSGMVQVQGSVTIAPFENNLGYRLYDTQGNELAAGPMQVISAEMGGPGTFDSAIDLSAIPAGTTIRLALADFSAADGSILALDSVELVVK